MQPLCCMMLWTYNSYWNCCKKLFPPQIGQRHTWTEEEDKLVKEFFSEEIGDVTERGNKGALNSKIYFEFQFYFFTYERFLVI